MENKVVKKKAKIQSLKPRNHVALAMIRSNKASGAHSKNHKNELFDEITNEEIESIYEEYEYYE